MVRGGRGGAIGIRTVSSTKPKRFLSTLYRSHLLYTARPVLTTAALVNPKPLNPKALIREP